MLGVLWRVTLKLSVKASVKASVKGNAKGELDAEDALRAEPRLWQSDQSGSKPVELSAMVSTMSSCNNTARSNQGPVRGGQLGREEC